MSATNGDNALWLILAGAALADERPSRKILDELAACAPEWLFRLCAAGSGDVSERTLILRELGLEQVQTGTLDGIIDTLRYQHVKRQMGVDADKLKFAIRSGNVDYARQLVDELAEGLSRIGG